MRPIHVKILVAGTVMAAALTYLAAAGVKKGFSYYLTVDQFSSSVKYHSDSVKLCGTVSADGLEIKGSQLVARFNLVGQTSRIPVVYHGVIPDMFRADSQVVVEGRLSASGVFESDSLMTKCASKYDAADSSPRPNHPHPSHPPADHVEGS
jgi:cytochrome c-type biogenesis protein CcmE